MTSLLGWLIERIAIVLVVVAAVLIGAVVAIWRAV